MRIVRGLLALVTLAGSLGLVPWLLLVLGHYPSRGDLGWGLLLTPDDGRVLLWLVTALGWVVWLLFTLSTAADLAGLLGRRPPVRLPGLRWMQSVSGLLLMAVLVMLGSSEHLAAGSATPRGAALAHAAPVTPVVVQPVASFESIEPDASQEVEEVRSWVDYTVVRGDDLWTLAETHLGSGFEWRAIVALNSELLAGDPDHLEPGWVLRLPAPSPPPLETPAPAAAAPTPEPMPDIQFCAPVQAAEVVAGPASQERDLVLAGTGTLVAAGVTTLLAGRRRRQLAQRPLGTIPRQADEQAVRLRNVMAATALPKAVDLVEWAVHMVAREAVARGAIGVVDWLRAGPSGIEFRWAEPVPTPVPDPFVRHGDSWTVDLAQVRDDRDGSPDVEALRPWPTLVTVGTDGEDTYLVDLERWGRLSVQARSGQRAGEVLTSYLLELATNPWAGSAQVLVVGDEGGLVDAGEVENIVHADTLDEVLPAWESTVATQQALAAAADGPIPLLRLDPDLAEAWAPRVLVLLTDITPAERMRLDGRFGREVRGPLVMLSEHPGGDATLVVDESPLRAELEPTALDLSPALVPRRVRDAVVELSRVTAPEALTAAPWWDNHPDETAAEELPMPDEPRLLLLGPVVLEGAHGKPPSRAPRQCLEYCAWLLEHPNCSSVEMARALLVAEPTRRSNMSRLRGWLGSSDEGEPYLPEAYSGRIRLHPAVRSDWQEVQILLGRGVELASDSTLVAILDMVRGAPLADAPPGGWTWAEELRIESACALRDVAYVLSERALAAGDLDLAKWAIGRGLVAAQGDETLLRGLLVAEHRAGNVVAVERLVFQLNDQARVLGVDLLPETVTTMQEVLEGGIRVRNSEPPRRAAV